MRMVSLLVLSLLFSSVCFAEDTVDIRVKIKEIVDINFNGNIRKLEYNDALYFTLEEYRLLTTPDIELTKEELKKKANIVPINVQKQQRINNWKYHLEHPAPYIEPTKEELEKMKTELQTQIDEIDFKIVEINAKKIDTKVIE